MVSKNTLTKLADKKAGYDDKLNELLNRQAIHRFGDFDDIVNVIDFFIKPESSFITGQVIYLGGV